VSVTRSDYFGSEGRPIGTIHLEPSQVFSTRSAKDPSTVFKEAIERFEIDWNDSSRRNAICSGKKAFASLNGQLQQKFGVSITSNQVIRFLSVDDVGDLTEVLSDLDQFAKPQPAILTAA
jgi:hypothetical protein